MSLEKPNDIVRIPTAAPFRRGAHWMALGAAVFTLPLLYVGGSVTTYRVGLAVPDWPQTFGINMFLFNMWDQPFGVRVEHSHRLYGAAVGLFTLVLAGWLLVFEPRRWMKWLGLAGGGDGHRSGSAGRIRESPRYRRFWRPFMRVSARRFSRSWSPSASSPAAAGRRPAGDADRSTAWLKLAGLGRCLPWCRPRSRWEAGCGIMGRGRHSLTSRHGAPVVWGCCLFLAFVVEQHKASWRASGSVGPGARAAGDASGCAGYRRVHRRCCPLTELPRTVSFYQAVTRTAHQTSGALLLAAAVVFNLRCFRHVAGVSRFRSERGGAAMSFRRGGSGRTRTGGRGLKSMASVEQFGLAATEPEAFLSAVASRAAAYLSLTKPRLVLLVLATVAAGFFLGARWEFRSGRRS